MADFYQRVQRQVGTSNLPPLERWTPELSGDIDIRIDSEGRWFHEGGQIERPALVGLFARILRRESDSQYYLVTPTEKWRIRVADYPLRVVAVERLVVDGALAVVATVNNNMSYAMSPEYPIALCAGEEGAYITLDYGLSAKFDRPAWYQLCEWVVTGADGHYLESAGTRFRLG